MNSSGVSLITNLKVGTCVHTNQNLRERSHSRFSVERFLPANTRESELIVLLCIKLVSIFKPVRDTARIHQLIAVWKRSYSMAFAHCEFPTGSVLEFVLHARLGNVGHQNLHTENLLAREYTFSELD